jgi:hypothetical protein
MEVTKMIYFRLQRTYLTSIMYISARHMNAGSYAWYAINFDADENKFSDNEQQNHQEIVGFIDD